MSRTHHHLPRGKPFTRAVRASLRSERRAWRSSWTQHIGCPSGRNCTVCGKDAKREELKRTARAAIVEARAEIGATP